MEPAQIGIDRRAFLRISAGAALTAGSLAGGREPAPGPPFAIDRQAGAIAALSLADKTISRPAAGGFAAFDPATRQQIRFLPGEIRPSPEGAGFHCASSDGLQLAATFVRSKQSVLVTGQLHHPAGSERGIVLDYWLPAPVRPARFSNGLNRTVEVGDAEEEGNTYPIAALCGAETGWAMAIPPDAPRCFGMVGSARGLATRFYLGLSPATLNFPSRASFAFLIYPVDPNWGFRSALTKYYGFFPRYYTPRAPRDGLIENRELDGPESYPPDQCGQSYVFRHDSAYPGKLARNRRLGLISIDYTIVGTREVKFLPRLPHSYGEAMTACANWKLSDQAGFPVGKESEAAGRDLHLREEIAGSACRQADGRFALKIRSTAWGGNSVSFYINPNPALAPAGTGRCVGADALNLIDRWLKNPLLDGLIVDSVGGSWPGILNYRPDHFQPARYPLTCDSTGRVALDNQISHYEFCAALRAKLHALDRKYLSANHVDDYATPAGTEVGRFFVAALLDFATSEPAAAVCSREFMRASMGRKPYHPTFHGWEDAPAVERWINHNLCYALFGSIGSRSEGAKSLAYFPAGYRRDRSLLDWFVPQVRLLSRAGWEPVTGAAVTGQKILVERYGAGDRIYFALMSESDREQRVELTIDLELLGLGPAGSPDNLRANEIARATPLDLRAGPRRIGLQLKPYRTAIVALTRSPSGRTPA